MKCSLPSRRGWIGLILTVGFLVTGASSAIAQGAAVYPNGLPAPALVASSWACYPTCVLPSAIAAGDSNTDGWADIAVSCAGTGQVFYYRNGGPAGAPGVFGLLPPPTVVGTSPGASSVVIANSGNTYWLSRVFGGGAFASQVHSPSNPPLALPGPGRALAMVSGELDRNPSTDDYVVLFEGGSFRVAIGGALLAPAYKTSGIPVDAVIADFNQDGWNDVAVAVSGDPSAIEIFYAIAWSPLPYGTGGGTLALNGVPVVIPLPIAPTAIDAGDFNADGLMDIVVVGNNGDEYAAVYLNNSATPGAAFAITAGGPMKTWGFEAVDVVVADFDGNGRDDFAVANRSSHNITIFLSDAETLGPDNRATSQRCLNATQLNKDLLTITFGLFKLELQCGYYPVSIDAADFDWNGKMDLAVALEAMAPEICPQNESCIEVMFDVACGFHLSQSGNVPNQVPHPQVRGVNEAGEETDCVPCKTEQDNQAPKATIGGESGN